ncbi:hypothetical protein NLJ89_g9753 [Agrocybe chaxingu]|uniref:Uncharacterized protein n=1 Tax=Agrocybe chaxingu TaxID=84603 RepID=A0A9W8JSM4_9AGAR|nr:hypothetical protein NLJ89_g9753 [Agrocybe chaxingu]
MPECLATPHLAPLQPHARCLLSRLFQDRVFFIVPKSDLGAMNPRELPRELYVEDGVGFSGVAAQKRKGRPPRREKGKKARMALEELEEWVSRPGPSNGAGMGESLAEYQATKASMMEALGRDPTFSSEELTRTVLARLEAARQSGSAGNGEHGLELMKEALADGKGIFNLLR